MSANPSALFEPLDPKIAEPVEQPGLPRVLLIGDSISIGYTLPVRARLAGEANVFRPGENCGSSAYGLERLGDWLGPRPWSVIHFNFGLHDLKYVDERGNYVTPDRGRQVTPLAQYGENLQTLLARLKKTGARLIFATTTPVPADTDGRVEGSEVAYNDVATALMRANGIAIDDLHAHVRQQHVEFLRPQNVHFSPQGSNELARRVAASIRLALGSVRRSEC